MVDVSTNREEFLRNSTGDFSSEPGVATDGKNIKPKADWNFMLFTTFCIALYKTFLPKPEA
jgi:hypothetical protein